MIPTADFSLIQAIKEALSIEQAVNRYLPGLTLRRRGRKLWGCCPFHSEKTPSFVIMPDSGQFKCFGCGMYGDSIDLVASALGLSLADAVKLLAEELGIASPEDFKTRREVQKRIDKARQNKLRADDFATKVREDSRFLRELYGIIKKDLKKKANYAADFDKPDVIGAIQTLGKVEILIDYLLSDDVAIQYRGLCGVEEIRECIKQIVITS